MSPAFIEMGEMIEVDTRTGEYLERVRMYAFSNLWPITNLYSPVFGRLGEVVVLKALRLGFLV